MSEDAEKQCAVNEPPRNETTYLSDGAYADYHRRSNSICVYASNGISESERIYLDANAISALVRFARKKGFVIQ